MDLKLAWLHNRTLGHKEQSLILEETSNHPVKCTPLHSSIGEPGVLMLSTAAGSRLRVLKACREVCDCNGTYLRPCCVDRIGLSAVCASFL